MSPASTTLIERISPICNLVSPDVRHQDVLSEDDATPVAVPAPTNTKTESAGPISPTLVYEPPPWPLIPPEETIRRLKLSLPVSRDIHDQDVPPRHVSERSQMVPERHGGLPGIVPGAVDLIAQQKFTRCEEEPIRIPGAIQSHGALVVLKYDGMRNLLVRITSENCGNILGFTSERLFQASCFMDLLATSQNDDFQARVDHVLEMGHDSFENTDLDAFPLSLISAE